MMHVALPFGCDLLVSAANDAIVTSDFVTKRRRTSREAPPLSPLLREARVQIEAYLQRRLQRFDLPLHYEGTPFEEAAWRAACELNFGESASYADLARAIGRPFAHRGVARAMGRSPLALFIPAHRVIGADGRIKGAAPTSMRARLLAFERSASRASVRGRGAR
ncbi:MAG TPA: methylated-DNA--[protein]-cysteine S-methyltransferase [Candidatus Dormibacteraeota bacterium]|nr:methylated-DNA--[protein]-cysteine S-methyltransferase [Candidatus Dormibacteraeota bacterium]